MDLDAKDLAELLSKVRRERPLVHHITNYVTVNDCANITMCIGAAPVMADAREEVEEMTGLASTLVLNIGTLNSVQVESMLLAGKAANRRNIPIVLDPVGAGATGYRTETAQLLLKELKVSVLKGNAGEIGVLAGTGGTVRGVDSHGAKGDPVQISEAFARSLGLVVVMSGATDVITDGRRTVLVDNGHERMGSISGTGCMAASVTAAFAAVSPDRVVSSAAALVAFGVAGEKAAGVGTGPYDFKNALFNHVAALSANDIHRLARFRVVRP